MQQNGRRGTIAPTGKAAAGIEEAALKGRVRELEVKNDQLEKALAEAAYYGQYLLTRVADLEKCPAGNVQSGSVIGKTTSEITASDWRNSTPNVHNIWNDSHRQSLLDAEEENDQLLAGMRALEIENAELREQIRLRLGSIQTLVPSRQSDSDNLTSNDSCYSEYWQDKRSRTCSRDSDVTKTDRSSTDRRYTAEDLQGQLDDVTFRCTQLELANNSLQVETVRHKREAQEKQRELKETRLLVSQLQDEIQALSETVIDLECSLSEEQMRRLENSACYQRSKTIMTRMTSYMKRRSTEMSVGSVDTAAALEMVEQERASTWSDVDSDDLQGLGRRRTKTTNGMRLLADKLRSLVCCSV